MSRPIEKPPKNGPRFAEVMKTEEKGSDVNLASYLLLDTSLVNIHQKRRDPPKRASRPAAEASWGDMRQV